MVIRKKKYGADGYIFSQRAIISNFYNCRGNIIPHVGAVPTVFVSPQVPCPFPLFFPAKFQIVEKYSLSVI